jgi:hypothetical protein
MRPFATQALATLLVAAAGFAGVAIVRAPEPVPTRKRAPTRPEPPHAIEDQRRAGIARPSADVQERSRQLIGDIEAALVSVDDRERERALRESLPQLMATNPSAAARILERTPHGFSRDEARDQIARLWAAADLDGALEWATTLAGDDDRRLATIEIRSQIAASDPATAIEISDLMDVGRNDGTLAHIAQMWAEENPSAAAAWAEKQPPSPLRDELLARIALVQVAHHPR